MRFSILCKSLLFMLIGLISACSKEDVAMHSDLNGKLIYGGQGILALNLANGEISTIKNTSSISVDGVSYISRDKYLISYFDLQPNEHRNRVAIYDVDSAELTDIQVGSRATFLRSYNKVLFYTPSGDLALADFDKVHDIKVINENPTSFPVSPIQISDNEFFFESYENEIYKLWKYNLDSGESTYLQNLRNCSLSRAIWKSSTQELLCAERGTSGVLTGKYFLYTFNGEKKAAVDFGSGEIWPVIYWPKLDGVLVQERYATDGRERHSLYLYSFRDSSRKLISESVLLSRDVILVDNL